MATPRTSQFNMGLSSAEAMAACGPAAAIAFAQTYGRNPTVGEAMSLARSVGWSAGGGMAGPASEQKLLSQMGVNSRLTMGADWNQIAQEAQTGNPVIISTPGHYFYADGYNAANGTYHVGTSGTDLRSGSEWMTPNQMQSLMGTAQATLYADHPLEGSSVATQNQTVTNGVQAAPANASFLNRWYGTNLPSQMGDMSYNPVRDGTPQQGYNNYMQGEQNQNFGSVNPTQLVDTTAYAGKPYVQEAIQAANAAGLDPNIFLRQINQESGFNPNAGSSAGAQGIAQIVPKYHPGVNTADPIASLNYAANLDKQLLTQYGGDYKSAMIAYNGGQGAVDAWNSGSPYAESQAYVNAILNGQTPATFNSQGTPTAAQQPSQQTQPQAKMPSPLHQMISSGSIYAPSNNLSGMLSNPYTQASIFMPTTNYQDLQPPTATPNPLNLFRTGLG